MTTVSAAMEAAVSHHQAGELDQAEDLCRLVIRIDPKHPDALYLLGVSAYQRGQTQHAAELINQAIAESDDAAPFYCKLAGVHRKLLRIDDAVENYEAAIRISPNCAEACFCLGEIYFESGNLDESRSWLERGVKLEPTDFQARIRLADLHRLQQNYSEAINEYQQAMSLKPDCPALCSKLAEACLLNDQLDEAVEYHQQSHRLDPNAVAVNQSWGTVLSELVKVDTLSRKIQHHSEPDDANSSCKLHPNEVLTIRRELSETIRAFEQSFALQKQAENVLSHVVSSIEQANNSNDPIPHLSLENVFPNGVYQELIENLPDVEHYERQISQPGEAEERDLQYQTISLDDDSLDQLPASIQQFWRRLSILFSSNGIGLAMSPHFHREISPDPNLLLIRGNSVKPDLTIPEIPHNAIVLCMHLNRKTTPNTGIIFECLGSDIPAHEPEQSSDDPVDSLLVVFGAN